jgi:hypothetical protein
MLGHRWSAPAFRLGTVVALVFDIALGRRPVRLVRCLAFAAAVLASPLAACSQPPPAPFAGPDPSDPRARVPAAAYRPTVAAYASQRPVEPLPWRKQNDRITPAPKP